MSYFIPNKIPKGIYSKAEKTRTVRHQSCGHRGTQQQLPKMTDAKHWQLYCRFSKQLLTSPVHQASHGAPADCSEGFCPQAEPALHLTVTLTQV